LKKTNLLYAEGIRLKDKESIVKSFVAHQKLNPKIAKPVTHISLDFSIQDKHRLTDQFMVGMAGKSGQTEHLIPEFTPMMSENHWH
jgi:hypothetical protein